MSVHPLTTETLTAPVDHVLSVIDDAETFAGMRDEWNALLDNSAASHPFLTWEWLSAWWRHLRGAAKLHVVIVRSPRQLIAAMPLMVVRRGLSPTRLEFLGTGLAGADYLDVIVRCGHESAVMQMISRAIDTRQMPLRLDHLPPSPIASGLSRHLEQNGWSVLAGTPDVCPFIELTGHSFESYLSSLGSSHRANFRRRLRALERDFTLRFTPADSHQERRDALEALFAFHDQRWADCGGTAFQTAGLRAFHQDLTRRAHEGGWLRMYTLRLNDAPAAVMYGFARDRRFYFYQHGFSCSHADRSVGLVLMGLTIRAALDEGMREFDLLYGHEPYKKLWARYQRPLGRLMLFPPRVSGRLAQHAAETRLAVRAFVQRLGWKGAHDAA